jgi:thiol:disulfide interchange protein DsbA
VKNNTLRALLIVASSAFGAAQAQAPEPVAGRDYIEIPNGSPLERAEGKVIVEEFFNYICPGCNAFEPTFLAWTADLPDYVKVVHVPATFRPDFVPYARAYYAAQALGIAEKTHADVYRAIHQTGRLPGEGRRIDEERIAEFYADYGVTKEQFLQTMRSFGVEAKLKRATEHLQRSRVPSTPSLVINGRYLVRGNTYADALRIANYLIEKERANAS